MRFRAESLIVDDDKGELESIHKSLGELQIPAIPYHYNEDDDDNIEVLHRGVRFCFLDIHILVGALSSDNKANFSAMQNLLSQLLAVDNGPYIAVAWTKEQKIFDEFKNYLMDSERMGNCPMPIDMVYVDKNSTQAVKDAEREINKALNRNPEFKALLDWEKTVKESAAQTVDVLYKVSTEANVEVEKTLTALGHGAIGFSNFAENLFMGINESLLPLLKDHQSRHEGDKSLWENAITNPNDLIDGPTRKAIAPNLNSYLLYDQKMIKEAYHIPGVIIEITEKRLQNLYPSNNEEESIGVSIADFLNIKDKKIKPKIKDLTLSWHLIEISPCCDFAQNKTPKQKYLLGLKIKGEESVLSKLKTASGSIMKTYTVKLDSDKGEPSLFCFSANHVAVLDNSWFSGESCKLRAREQLYAQVQKHYAQHVTRIGLIAV